MREFLVLAETGTAVEGGGRWTWTKGLMGRMGRTYIHFWADNRPATSYAAHRERSREAQSVGANRFHGLAPIWHIMENYYCGMDGLNEQSPILLKVKVRTGALVQLNVAGFRGVE